MEALEKQILHDLINNKQIELTQNELAHFSLEFHKQYNLINKMTVQGLPIDKVNLELYAIMEGQEINPEYAEANEQFEGKNISDIVNLKVRIKQAQQENVRIQNLVAEIGKGNKSAVTELQKILSQMSGKIEKSSITTLADYYQEQKDFYRQVVDGETLDGLIFWGHGKKNTKQFMRLSNILKRIAPTDLVFIAARPSVGKTSFALAMMNALYKNGYKPLFISLEMTNGELLQRLATAKSAVSYDALLSPNTPLTPKQMADYESGLLEASKMDVKLINNPPTSWLEMKQLIIRAITVDKIDYVVLDHMHIISSYDGSPNINKNQMYGDISRDMKLLARDYGVPIIVLAQLNREVRGQKGKGGKRIDPSYIEPFSTDLRDSGSLEQDADKILMLYREYPDQAEEHERWGRYPIVCKIEKNRSGKLGSVKYWFYAKNGRWAEADFDEDRKG